MKDTYLAIINKVMLYFYGWLNNLFKLNEFVLSIQAVLDMVSPIEGIQRIEGAISWGLCPVWDSIQCWYLKSGVSNKGPLAVWPI